MSPAAGADETTESPEGEDRTRDESVPGHNCESLFDRVESLTLFRVVGAVALVAVLARVLALGARTAHWDEARVAYWAYFYLETGSLAYHWEEHGPLAQIAAARAFEYLGVNDFAARLPVALVGGLLPLAALLYRNHLRRSETVGLAVLLAGNAVLLYYSRFMRSDVLLAAFMFVALGLFVRYYDTRRPRYLLGAGVFLGLGFASKENAIVYLLTWGGAAAVLADQFLHSPAADDSGLDRLQTSLAGARDRLRAAVSRADHAVAMVAAWLVTMVVLFAPRGQGLDRRRDPDTDADPVTIGETLQSPTELPALVEGSLRTAFEGYREWFAESEDNTLETYLSFLGDYLVVLVEHAPAVFAFAIVGIVVERYASARPRGLVMFMSYCGVASLVGYPLGSHVAGDSAWLSTHVVVPLSIPAAVGLGWTYRTGRELARDRSLDPALALVVLVVLGGLWAWSVPAQAVYVEGTDPGNSLVQFAQPASDLTELTETMEAARTERDGTHVVVFYGERGERFDSDVAPVRRGSGDDFSGRWQVEPACSSWPTTQPLNWYFAVADVETGCERSPETLADAVDNGEAPVVVTVPEDETRPVEAFEESHAEESYFLRNVGREIVVYTDRSLERERG